MKSANVHTGCSLVFVADLRVLELFYESLEGLLRQSVLLHRVENFFDAFPEIAFADAMLV